jgi:hypothetical protein
VTGGGTTGPSAGRRALVLVGVAVCAAAVWFFWPSRRPDEAGAPPAAADQPAAAPVGEARRALPRAVQATTPVAPVTANDDLAIMPAHEGEPVHEGMHPHPITPQHKRLFEENRLIGQLDGAMDVKDVAGMRRLLEEYRRGYPEDDQQVQDGYAVIADCFEHPGPASRTAAEHWLPSHNGSRLKRFVLRHCLEPQPQ